MREAYAGLVRAVDGSTEKAQRVALVANQVRWAGTQGRSRPV